MNIGDKVRLKISVDHLPIGSIGTIIATDKIFESTIPSCYRHPGMLKIYTYGYEGNSGKSTHYNTYIHSSNVIKLSPTNGDKKYNEIWDVL